MPKRFLQGFRGRFLQCDGYDGYECLTGVERPEGPWTLVHCWSHLRRRFVKQMRNTKSPIAEAAVRQIATLYAIEASVRGMPPAARLAARQAQSAPIVAALKTWFEKQLSMISSGSTLAADIRYGLAHWPGLIRYLEDGRLEMDTNPVENAIRPVALTRSFCPCRAGSCRPLPLASAAWATLRVELSEVRETGRFVHVEAGPGRSRPGGVDARSGRLRRHGARPAARVGRGAG